MNLHKRFTDEEREDWGKMKSNEGKRLFLQAYFKKDFSALVDLLGHKDTGKFHQAAMEELGKVRYITDAPVRRLWLWSRGFFKTTVITEDHSIYLIINNPNIRILLPSFTIEVSKLMLKSIREQFTTNADFRYFFREFCPTANKEGKIEFGTTEQFTVPNRTKVYKEPTMMCAGVGTNITGLHFDYMKPDDLVTKDSVTNDIQVQASKDYYSSLRFLYDNTSIRREDISGTIYHFNDLHCELIKNPLFQKSIIPISGRVEVINGEIKHFPGDYNFPERINEERFKSIQSDPNISTYDIQSQYYLNPIDPSKRKFKDEWIKYYDELPAGLSEYVLGDPASTKKKTSDYTVIERWGVDDKENFYLLDGYRDRLLSNERVDLYVGVAKQCKKLRGAKYEVIGGRHGDLENIRDKFLIARLPVEPKETKSSTASKQDRIEQRLNGQFNAGKIFLPRKLPKVYRYDGKSYDFVEEYLLEYRQFPFSEHDDILDCHTQLFDGEYIIKGDKESKPDEKVDEFEWWRQQAINRNKRGRTRHVFGGKSLQKLRIPATISFR